MKRGRLGYLPYSRPKKEDENAKILKEIYWIASNGFIKREPVEALDKIITLTDKFALIEDSK